MKFARWALVLAALPAAVAVGGTRDENNCLTSGGYSWDMERACCKRAWEADCAEEFPAPLGDDSADMVPHTPVLGDDSSDMVPHSPTLGGDGHDMVPHSPMLGGDGHDYVDHPTNLLGANGHGQQQMFGSSVGSTGPNRDHYTACKNAGRVVEHDGYTTVDPECMKKMAEQEAAKSSMAGSIGPNKAFYKACKDANRVIQHDGYTTIDPACMQEMAQEAAANAAMAGSVGPNQAIYKACKDANRVIQHDGYTTIDPACIQEMTMQAQQVQDAFSAILEPPVFQHTKEDRRMDAWYAKCMAQGRTIEVDNGRSIVDPMCLREMQQLADLPSTSGIAHITVPVQPPAAPPAAPPAILPGALAPKPILSGATAPPAILPGALAPKPILSGATDPCPEWHMVCTEAMQAQGRNCIVGECVSANVEPAPQIAEETADMVVHKPRMVDDFSGRYGGGNHDMVPHQQPVIGGGDHDMVPHQQPTIGGGDHDMVPHTIGGDGHDCRRRCHKMYKPVCASNGRTFANACVFQVAHCMRKARHPDSPDVTVLHTGACQNKKILPGATRKVIPGMTHKDILPGVTHKEILPGMTRKAAPTVPVV